VDETGERLRLLERQVMAGVGQRVMARVGVPVERVEAVEVADDSVSPAADEGGRAAVYRRRVLVRDAIAGRSQQVEVVLVARRVDRERIQDAPGDGPRLASRRRARRAHAMARARRRANAIEGSKAPVRRPT